jgi:hypothetical protein
MKKITKSLKKYFRSQKAKIRREIDDPEEQKEQIKKLYLDKGFNFDEKDK